MLLPREWKGSAGQLPVQGQSDFRRTTMRGLGAHVMLVNIATPAPQACRVVLNQEPIPAFAEDGQDYPRFRLACRTVRLPPALDESTCACIIRWRL